MTGFWGAVMEEREAREDQASEVLEAAGNSQMCRVSDNIPFDCIAITAPNPSASAAYLDELVARLDGGGTKEVMILAVSDPEGVRIGSGGGTLNAVLEIDEALRAAGIEDGDSDPHAPGLAASRVLLVHSGGDSQRSPTQCVCGKAWSALNSCGNDHSNPSAGEGRAAGCNTPMDLLLDHLSRLFSGGGTLPLGSLVVTACDVMLRIPAHVAAAADWSVWSSDYSGDGVAGLSIAADARKYAPNHGVYCFGENGVVGLGGSEDEKCSVMGVKRYLQKPSYELAEQAGAFLPSSDSQESVKPNVAVDTGVVLFSGKATDALVKLASSDTFKGYTSRGVGDGAAALRLELYSDLLLALKTDAGADPGTGGVDAYLAACGPALPSEHPLSKARLEVWDALSGFPLGAMLLRGATFVHLGTTPELLDMMTLRLPAFVEPYGLTARAGSVVGRACSVEDDPPAIIINSKLSGAGVVAGGSVVEHCRLDGDGWEIGAGGLISGVRSVPADHRLRLRSGMCLQQTDMDYEEDEADEEADDCEEDETSETIGEAALNETDQDEVEEEAEVDDDQEQQSPFVVSLFGAADDIQSHYTASQATFCGATWNQFLGYTGASVEDIWPGVPESARTLWSAKLFPVYRRGYGEQDTTDDVAERVLWMQDVQDTDAAPPQPTSSTFVKKWLSGERLSFKDILLTADPAAEFQWRRRLEENMEAKPDDGAQDNVDGGGGRLRGEWDAVALATRNMEELREAQRSLRTFAANAMARVFCIPPPRPFDNPPPENGAPSNEGEGMERDGPLVLNALLVAAERYSALKRGRFGSETSGAALQGMNVLLCLRGDCGWEGTSGAVAACHAPGGGDNGGVCILQRDGSCLLLANESLSPLLSLCQSDPVYQGVTYLGADNGIPRSASPPDGSTAPLAYLIAAAISARTCPPKLIKASTGPSRAVESNLHLLHFRGVDAIDVRRTLEEMRTLDEKAADESCTVAGGSQALARVACRLYDLADRLGGGGHRSGPGEHPEWQAQLRGLDTLRLAPEGGWASPAALPLAVAGLKRLREKWIGNGPKVVVGGGGREEGGELADAHLVVRCARHYERAAAVLVSAAVATASSFIDPPPASWLHKADHATRDDRTAAQHQRQPQLALPVGTSVTSRAAARIDLAGGWTDTPPISYEAGGSVLNVAVTVSGERPVEARCERIEHARVDLVCEGREGAQPTVVVCTELDDFRDFCVPQAPASLLKAVLICAGVVTLSPSATTSDCGQRPGTPDTLGTQLGRVFGRGGIRITSRSRLPQGSGMGASSILAGVVLSSVCVAAGRAMSRASLVHAVLRVEQLMTAGGGHQDQVGGLLGGVKITRSAASLPLQVCPENISLDPVFENALNERLLLVFTGKQRLARDLLQGVVRGWHDRLPSTVAAVKELVSNAEEAANACRGRGNLEALGLCLSTYWEQKKRMAPGAEPPQVKTLLDKLRFACHGLSVCGAGGGGFVACITRNPGAQGLADVTEALSEIGPSSNVPTVTVHRGRLDPEGMEIAVDVPDVV